MVQQCSMHLGWEPLLGLRCQEQGDKEDKESNLGNIIIYRNHKENRGEQPSSFVEPLSSTGIISVLNVGVFCHGTPGWLAWLAQLHCCLPTKSAAAAASARY